MIKPNIDEIRMLTGKSCDDLNEIIEAARTIHQKGVRSSRYPWEDGSLAVSDESVFGRWFRRSTR